MNNPKIVSIKPTAIPIAPASGSGPAHAAGPQQSAVEFREVLRLIGGGEAGRDVLGRIVFTEPCELVMRRVMARYGFDRLPDTYGELFGLFEYCDSLDAASGVGLRPKDQLAEWQAASFVVWRRKQPQLMPAIERYCAADTAGLRELHNQEDTLTTLGLNYLMVEDDE